MGCLSVHSSLSLIVCRDFRECNAMRLHHANIVTFADAEFHCWRTRRQSCISHAFPSGTSDYYDNHSRPAADCGNYYLYVHLKGEM